MIRENRDTSIGSVIQLRNFQLICNFKAEVMRFLVRQSDVKSPCDDFVTSHTHFCNFSRLYIFDIVVCYNTGFDKLLHDSTLDFVWHCIKFLLTIVNKVCPKID